jgi:hypothetical protein
MNRLRKHFLRKLFTLLAGLTFLNMSFILAEIAMLGLKDKYNTLVQNIINAGLEEEKELGGETGESEFAKEVNLIQHHLVQYRILFTKLEDQNKRLGRLSLCGGFLQRFSPPPERI